MLAVAALVLSASAVYRFPAEWEPHRAIWMSWPTYDNKQGYPVSAVTTRIVQALRGNVRVEMLVRDKAEMAIARRAMGNDSNVRFTFAPNSEIWTRDFGPIFLSDGKGNRIIADFGFNYWGYLEASSAESKREEATERVIARARQLPLRRSSLISEGGNREFNGKGTMMAVEYVEKQRNPEWTRERMEAEFKRVFGVRKVIWLQRGAMEDDLTFEGPLPGNAYTVITTGGHVDNVARFVDSRTVLMPRITEEEAKASPIMFESRKRLRENLRILSGSRDQDGNPFRVVFMPAADPVFSTMKPGDSVYDFIKTLEYPNGHKFPVGKSVKVVEAGSYMNFLITNGVVLTSRFWRPGLPPSVFSKDRESIRILQRLFPNRRIIALDTTAVNLGGGGIHCITQQEPAY
jgi:agmatine deiminase